MGGRNGNGNNDKPKNEGKPGDQPTGMDAHVATNVVAQPAGDQPAPAVQTEPAAVPSPAPVAPKAPEPVKPAAQQHPAQVQTEPAAVPSPAPVAPKAPEPVKPAAQQHPAQVQTEPAAVPSPAPVAPKAPEPVKPAAQQHPAQVQTEPAPVAPVSPAIPDGEGFDNDDDEAEPARPATATLMPCNNGQTDASPAARELLLDACERFGVNPTQEVRPRELASWNYYPGDRLAGRPAAVVIVTAGGTKLKHWEDPAFPMDSDTEETLARAFRAFTKTGDRSALPVDLALPIQLVTGFSTKTEHRFRRGYLNEGGKGEAARRDRAARTANKGKK